MDDTFNFFDVSLFDEKEKTAIMKPESSILVLDENRMDLCEDIRLDKLPETLEEIEMQIDRLKQKWSEFTYLLGQRIKYIFDGKLYEAKGYKDFRTYTELALKMSVTNSYYFMDIFNYFTEEQTKKAGSKLKLLLPILKEIRRDKELSDDIKDSRIKDLRDELFIKIYDRTYREAERIIKEVRGKYFTEIEEIEKHLKIDVKKDRIIIYEQDNDIKKELIKIIKEFYKLD